MAGIRRSLSLKGYFSGNKRRGDPDEQKTDIQVKPAFVQLHVSSEDLGLHPSSARSPRRSLSQRITWPNWSHERKPGSYSFDFTPTLTKTPWELDRTIRPSSRQSRGSSHNLLSSQKLQQLPKEILQCIFDKVKEVHSSGCKLNVTAYQNDLRALCLIDKRWYRIAREHLYRELWLPRNEELSKSILTFRKIGSRLKLLLRTLEDSLPISNIVRRIRVTAALAEELEFAAWANTGQLRKGSALHILRDIILKCRNLEDFSGYAFIALELAAEVLWALSSRQRLRSHIWRLPYTTTDPRHNISSSDFLNCHTNWKQLESLVICQQRDGCVVGPGIISAAVQRLPSLKHLTLRWILPSDFHNGTLLMLPALKSLRLEETHGITDQGIEQLAHSRLAMSLERLILAGLELTSLLTVHTVLANFSNLREFSLLQDTSPEIPQWYSATNNNFSLKSASLRYLYWDVLFSESSTIVLANSIAAGKFPNLRTVKVPCDSNGIIQGLCRPIAQQPITRQDLAILEKLDLERRTRPSRSLPASQTQAQLRIRRQRKQPSFNVVIQDEHKAIRQTHVIGSYLGNIGSKIEYSLEPAIQGTDHALARIDDLVIPRKVRGEGNLGPGEEDMLDSSVLF